MSMYRIGRSDFFTSGDLQADAATLDRQIALLDNQDMTKVTQTWFEGWQAFWSEWKRFYSDVFLNSIIGPGWNDSNRDQLIQFEERFGQWEPQWEAQSSQKLPGGPPIAPSTGAQDGLGDHLANQLRPIGAVFSTYKWWFIGGGIVVGLVLFREPLSALASKAIGKVK
jgi:hypothetical protein